MDDRTRQAVERLRAGDPESARQILAGVLLDDRDNLAAWLCLSTAVETDSDRAACLRQALALDPGNPLALRALEELKKRTQGRVHPASRPAQRHPLAIQTRPLYSRRAGGKARREPRYSPPGRSPERVLCTARPSLAVTVFWGLAGLLVLAAAVWLFRERPVVQFLILLPAGVTGLCVYFLHFLTRLYARYTLTNRRLILEGGVIHPQRTVLSVLDLTQITSRPSWLGAFFGTADLVVVDRSHREYYLYAVWNSRAVLNAFQTALAVHAVMRDKSLG